ncbi:hypothetical protein [Tumebacillus flagellatus]|uniref:Uncharacterized protein n=1 Tax=Tumebacillus flagellatus TaxID=1157490 RepID=A0A074LPQ9_9BACL|nr:hypothetical protein [Tumebacillus flagellatus]KEO84096.1 hypothetical protein EL26_06430 [Tumebacillus flagellatus]
MTLLQIIADHPIASTAAGAPTLAIVWSCLRRLGRWLKRHIQYDITLSFTNKKEKGDLTTGSSQASPNKEM